MVRWFVRCENLCDGRLEDAVVRHSTPSRSKELVLSQTMVEDEKKLTLNGNTIKENHGRNTPWFETIPTNHI